MCLLDYDFMVLNNAFVTHRPQERFKKVKGDKHPQRAVVQQNKVKNKIYEELNWMYGGKPECGHFHNFSSLAKG